MKKLLLLVLALIVLASAASGAWVYSDLRKPVSHARSGQYIEIPKGSSPSWIVNKLLAEGIIKHEWPLKLYLKSTGKGATLKAGEYDFPSPISPLSVVAKLQQGQRRLDRITIPEGWTRWDIAREMVKLPELHLASEAQALALMDNVSLIRDIDPKATNLEGYLFPDTYEFSPETSAADLVELNEAFAAQVLACDRELHFDHDKLNVNGGSIALGHPIGCTGTRITVTLLHEMLKRKSKLGIATLCVSGGMGIAMAIENVA